VVSLILKGCIVLILYRIKPVKLSEGHYIDYILIGMFLCIL
jgi:hypothetical protein